MSHRVVKFKIDDDGYKVDYDKWHLVVNLGGSTQKLCSGEVFGLGESGAVFEQKEVEKKGVTCGQCLSIIKFFKKLDV